jgi:hypothetical protein
MGDRISYGPNFVPAANSINAGEYSAPHPGMIEAERVIHCGAALLQAQYGIVLILEGLY